MIRLHITIIKTFLNINFIISTLIPETYVITILKIIKIISIINIIDIINIIVNIINNSNIIIAVILVVHSSHRFMTHSSSLSSPSLVFFVEGYIGIISSTVTVIFTVV